MDIGDTAKKWNNIADIINIADSLSLKISIPYRYITN